MCGTWRSKVASVRPPLTLNRLRTSCAPASLAARSPASTTSVAQSPIAARCPSRSSPHINMSQAAVMTSISPAGLASHQVPATWAVAFSAACLRPGRRQDRLVKRGGHVSAADQKSSAASTPPRSARGPGRPFSGAISVIKVSGFAARSMFAPPPTYRRLAVARDQRHRGSSFGTRLVSQASSAWCRGAAEHDRVDADGATCHSVSMRRSELLLRHALRLPVRRPDQQSWMRGDAWRPSPD